jgi:hypothetical protein
LLSIFSRSETYLKAYGEKKIEMRNLSWGLRFISISSDAPAIFA